MAKATQGRKPARKTAGKASGARKAGARPVRKGGAKARPAGKGKAPAKRFFVGKAPKPAQGRAGLKEAALRPRSDRKPRKAAPPPAAAPVAPVAAPPPPPVPDEGMLRARAAVAAAFDKKAENPVVLDVRGLSGVADYFVLLSADSDRQAAAVADAVDERLVGMGAQRLGTEGRAGGGWVLLDFGDVVVHVMSPESRGFYDLEGLWADAPRVAVK
jgi:ribosome-associated protein